MTRKDYWTPAIGDEVWLNYPDAQQPMGTVVGFVPDGEVRAGQPIIQTRDERTGEGGLIDSLRPHGEKRVAHPQFLLPFPYGGVDWKRAVDEGRVR